GGGDRRRGGGRRLGAHAAVTRRAVRVALRDPRSAVQLCGVPRLGVGGSAHTPSVRAGGAVFLRGGTGARESRRGRARGRLASASARRGRGGRFGRDAPRPKREALQPEGFTREARPAPTPPRVACTTWHTRLSGAA